MILSKSSKLQKFPEVLSKFQSNKKYSELGFCKKSKILNQGFYWNWSFFCLFEPFGGGGVRAPGIGAACAGVPAVAPSMGMASSQAMAFLAMAPMTPLGAFQPQQPAGLINLLGQPLPQADELKTKKFYPSFR